MRLALFSAAMIASVSVGATAGVLDLRAPHVDTTALENSPPLCAPVTFKVYFEQGVARLTEPAEQTLDVIGHRIDGCAVSTLDVQSAATDVDSAEGRHIAGLRGAAVIAALRERGVVPEAVVVSKVGSDSEPASAAPEHITISIDAARTPLSAERPLRDGDV